MRIVPPHLLVADVVQIVRRQWAALNSVERIFLLGFSVSGSALAQAGGSTVTIPTATDVKAFAILTRDVEAQKMSSDIAGCGIAAAKEHANERYAIRLTLAKDMTRPGGTVFWLTSTWTNAQGHSETIAQLSLKTESMASPYVSSDIENWNDGEGLKSGTSLGLSDFESANMMRELMLSGAQIGIETKAQRAAVFRIAGPLPASDRATYLNCAGDLYRPE